MVGDGSQAAAWPTAVNAVVPLQRLARGTWAGASVPDPEALDALPFLDLRTGYGSPWGCARGG